MLRAIDDTTLLVPISFVLFKSAFIQDAKAICRRAREVGRATCVLDILPGRRDRSASTCATWMSTSWSADP
jgi:hypothetical protein